MNHDKVGEEKRKTWNEKDKNPSCLTCYTVYAKKNGNMSTLYN